MTKRPSISAGEIGFTLIEMLVAMTIFAILAAAGVGILRSSVDTQAAVDRRLGEIGEIGRLQALLANDLGQAVERQTRDGQISRPSFIGEAGRMAFVRGGWSNLDDAPRSSLQRVEWRLAEGGLARVGHRQLDGADATAPAVMARGATASFRFRQADGSWSSTFASTPRFPLPAAVEATVTPRQGGAVTLIVALPEIEHSPPPVPGTPA